MSASANKAKLIKPKKQSQQMATMSKDTQNHIVEKSVLPSMIAISKASRSIISNETIHREDQSVYGNMLESDYLERFFCSKGSDILQLFSYRFVVKSYENRQKILSFNILPKTEAHIKADIIMHSNMLTHMLAHMIRFAVEELKLIGAKYMRQNNTVCDLTNLTLDEKCTKPLFELHDYPTYLLGKNEVAYSLYKFHMDQCLLETILMNLVDEIIRKKSYEEFSQNANNLLSSTEEENNYLRETDNGKRASINVEQMIYKKTYINKDVMNGLNAEVTLYKNQLEDLKKENFMKEQYTDKWEKSRNRQNNVKYKQKIVKLEREMNEYQSMIAREDRVHVEVEKYTQMVHVDIEKELVIWSERYETELEEKELQIQNLRETAQDMFDNLARFKIQFNNRVMVLEEGRKVRAERIARNKILANQEVAAVKIQAWWRRVRIRIRHMKKKRSKRGGKKNDAAKMGAVQKKGSIKVKGKK